VGGEEVGGPVAEDGVLLRRASSKGFRSDDCRSGMF